MKECNITKITIFKLQKVNIWRITYDTNLKDFHWNVVELLFQLYFFITLCCNVCCFLCTVSAFAIWNEQWTITAVQTQLFFCCILFCRFDFVIISRNSGFKSCAVSAMGLEMDFFVIFRLDLVDDWKGVQFEGGTGRF